VEVTVINRTAIVSSLVIIIISITRLLIVSNYQVPIAVAIAYSNGTISTLTGTFVPLVPLLLPLTTQLLALCALGALVSGSETRHPLFLATITAFIATVFVTSTKLPIKDIFQQSTVILVTFAAWTLVLLLLISVLVDFINLPARGLRWVERSTSIILLVFITVAVPTVASYSLPSPSEIRHVPDVLRRVWLPAELIGTKNGLAHVGYVLKVDGSWTTILWDSDRSIEIKRTPDITSRTICRIGSPDGLPLIFVQSVEVPIIEPCEFPIMGRIIIPPPRMRLPW
jgi:hypothetical protein